MYGWENEILYREKRQSNYDKHLILQVEELLAVLRKKPEETEVIITGRYAPPELISLADLVTEMKEIKHYFTKGVKARKGIEY